MAWTFKKRTTGFGKGADLTTAEGLLEFATEDTKLSKKIQKIASKPKEDPDVIFSGGLISDIFDGLNALQYGVVGLVKGKTFGEGVKTRESFSKKDALGKYGVPGMIAGIAADIALDPLTYVGGFGIGKRIFAGLEKAAPVAVKAMRTLPLGDKVIDFLGSKFVYRFGQDPVYADLAERMIKNIGIGQENLLDIARPLMKLDPEIQKIIATARKAGKLEELPEDILKVAKPAFDELDKLGKQAVEAGLLDAKTYEQNVGRYMARLYKTKEAPEKVGKYFFGKKPLRIDLSRFKKRQDIPEEIREAMGEMLEAGYPTAKSLVQLKDAVEKANFFKTVTQKWGVDEMAEGLAKLPDTKRLGELAGKYVPKAIFEDLDYMVQGAKKAGIQKQLVAGFKYGKVILNPATHGRNILSNFILNSFEGLSPARLDIYAEAAKEIATKGKWYQEAKSVGLGLNTFAARELKDILTGVEGKGLSAGLKRAGKKIASIYQGEEEFAKLAQYIFQRKSGLGIEEAWKVAERATFNYAQVTPFIRRLRESVFGMPFITFCVSVDTEILTQDGWKTFDKIKEKDMTLAYDIKTGKLKWQSIKSVNVFPYVGKMKYIRSRSLDILMTPDHRNVVERTLHRRLSEKHYTKEIMVVKANKLTKMDRIVVAGKYNAPIKKTIDDKWVKLVGWGVTEGYIVNKSNALYVGQTNKEGQKEIESLRKEIDIERFNIQEKRFKLGGYKLHKVYYFPAKIRDVFLKYAPNKNLTVKFLKKLTKDQLELLYKTLLLADGCVTGSQPVLIQNPGETANSMQILGVMLGKQFGWSVKQNCLSITVTKGNKRQLRRNLPTDVGYSGLVWCPQTNFGTWVARRNGKVFITGNTYKATPQVLKTMIKYPTRISNIGKIKNAIESLSDRKILKTEREAEPDYIRDGFFMRLPKKDKYGRSAYFDLSYIIPFGEILSGQLYQPGVSETAPQTILGKFPAFNVIGELFKNKDFFGNKIVKDSSIEPAEQGKDIFQYLLRFYSPPLLEGSIETLFNADAREETGLKGLFPGRLGRSIKMEEAGATEIINQMKTTRTVTQELLRAFLGLKVTPFNVDKEISRRDSELRKKLQQILIDEGLIKEFTIPFVPK